MLAAVRRLRPASLGVTAMRLGAAALPVRCLSSRPPPRGRRDNVSPRETQLMSDLETAFGLYDDRMDASTPPRLRGAPPPPLTHILETWAPAALVSPLREENALTFRTRFYIDATGQQQYYSAKVQLNINIRRLGLGADEEARLLAVARPFYRKKNHELHMSCTRYLEVARNKAHLRQTVSHLLADARTNARAHAATPDAELPLAARSQQWLPGDHRTYRRHPPKKFKKTHKSPG